MPYLLFPFPKLVSPFPKISAVQVTPSISLSPGYRYLYRFRLRLKLRLRFSWLDRGRVFGERVSEVACERG